MKIHMVITANIEPMDQESLEFLGGQVRTEFNNLFHFKNPIEEKKKETKFSISSEVI
jgi:hypothetical protein